MQRTEYRMLFLYFQLLTTCRRRKMFQRNLTCSAPGSAEMDEERNLEDIIRSDVLYSGLLDTFLEIINGRE